MTREVCLQIGVGAVLMLCAVLDLRKKALSGGLLLLLGIAALPFGIFIRNATLLERLLGSGLGLVMLGISRASGGSVGSGDGLLLCITGFLLGFWENLWMLCYAFFLLAIVAVILLSFRLVGKKKKLPFIPFLFLGYVMMSVMEVV